MPLGPQKRRGRAPTYAPSGLSSKLLCLPPSPRKPGCHRGPSQLGSSGDEVWGRVWWGVVKVSPGRPSAHLGVRKPFHL